MRKTALTLGALALAWSAATAAANATEPAPSVWSLNADQELRYMSWHGSRGFPAGGSTEAGSGAQLYAPLTIQAVRQPVNDTKLELIARGGYVWSQQSTPGLTGSVSTATDTVVSGTATYLGIPGLQPFVSFSTNMPSGAAALYGSAARARMDPDIVDIATFGEGWNVGPTAGVNIPITPTLMLTLSSGYTWRGDYNTEGPIDPSTPDQSSIRIAPGQVTTHSVSLGTQIDNLMLQITALHISETPTERDHVQSYQLGNRYMVSGMASYAWTPSSRSTLTASWTNALKNKVFDTSATALVPEVFLSNSSIYRLRLEHAFSVDAWSIAPMANYMQRDQNSYDPPINSSRPRRVSAPACPPSIGQVTIVLKASAEHFWIKEKHTELTPDLSVQGWIAMVGGTLTF